MQPRATRRGNGPVVAVVPARYGSSRFPGKPLVDLAGAPMIARVLERLARAKTLDALFVATDDARIFDTVEQLGFRAVMTSESCASGTDRVAEAISALELTKAPGLVVNVQGDEPLLDPNEVDTLVEATLAAGTELGTLARPFAPLDRFADPNLVKVVCRADGRALYFSRAPIPVGGPTEDQRHPLLHVGIYAFQPRALARFVSLPPSPLERAERLEQLRALENGLSIHVAIVPGRPSPAVDTPEDVARVITILNHGSQTSEDDKWPA